MVPSRTRRPLLSLAGVIVVFLAGASILLTRMLQEPIFAAPISVTVQLPSAGGLYSGSDVTYRGASVGKVLTVGLSPAGQVQARLRLQPGTAIPALSRVKVRSLSPVGEQYLDFQPSGSQGPYLVDGSTVTGTATDIPMALASTLQSVNAVLAQINPADLQVTLHGLGTAFRGTGSPLARIIDNGNILLSSANENWPALDAVLRQSDVLLKALAGQRTNVLGLSNSAELFTRALREADPTIRAALAHAPHQLAEIAQLIGMLDHVLPGALARVNDLSSIFAVHDPHLRALLQVYPAAIKFLGDSMYNHAIRGQLVFQQDFQCQYDTQRTNYWDRTRRAPNPNGQCQAPADRMIRGARNAPGPLAK